MNFKAQPSPLEQRNTVEDLDFSPGRMRLARELRGWTQTELARHLGLTAAAVSQFESGSSRPTEMTLNKLTKALDVPSGFLVLPLVDTHEGFFRSLRKSSAADRRRARATAHIAHDLATEVASDALPPLDVPRHPVEDLEIDEGARKRIEAVAQSVRRAWNVSSGPVSNMVELLEQHGVVVIRLPLQSADVDAFSLPFHDRPVVVLATDKNDKARSRFDAAHELGHLVLHGEQIWGVKEVEKQANYFAAAFLMPAAEITRELPTRADWPTLFALKLKWQVSIAALLMRAKTLRRMEDAQYLAAIKAVSARGWRRTEPVPLGAPEHPQLFSQLLASSRNTHALATMPASVIKSLEAAAA